MNNSKQNKIFSIVGITSILIVGAFIFNIMNRNHEENQATIDKCFEDFNSTEGVVLKKDSFKFTCEKK